MHVIALVESPDHVCCRYRLILFREPLERRGHSLELLPWPRSWWGRLTLHQQVRHADAVIIQRKLLPSWQLHLLRRAVPFLLFDYDDAVFARDSYARKGPHDPVRQRRFAATVRAADAVIAGNPFLAAEAGRWTAPHRIHVIPTCVEPARYPIAAHDGTDVRLVWVGSKSTLQGLRIVTDLLDEIGRSVRGVSLRLICDDTLSLRELPVEFVPWTEAGEAEAIAGADIGITWIPDDLWSRGKCGLKVLQYMAAGLPVVANPVGVHPDMVRHGENGFLARTPGEWMDAIRTLARDPHLRRQMGRAGRDRVEREFSVRAGADRWLGVLAHLDAGRKSA